jgi:hypothetical protein
MLKAELGERFDSLAEAKEELFDYIELFYNQKRRHSSLDYVSPAEYERKARGVVPLAAFRCHKVTSKLPQNKTKFRKRHLKNNPHPMCNAVLLTKDLCS